MSWKVLRRPQFSDPWAKYFIKLNKQDLFDKTLKGSMRLDNRKVLVHLGPNILSAILLDKHVINSTLVVVNLRISHFTWKPLNATFKYVSHDPQNDNVIYQFKCHCDSTYIGRTSQRFHLRRDQHVSKILRNWMAKRGNKPTKSPSAVGDHSLKYPEFNIIIITKLQFYL